MRTTMIIDDELLRRAKKRAADNGTTVSEVVNRALREVFTRPAPSRPTTPFRMVTFGRGLARVDHGPGDFARVLEDEDDDSLRDH